MRGSRRPGVQAFRLGIGKRLKELGFEQKRRHWMRRDGDLVDIVEVKFKGDLCFAEEIGVFLDTMPAFVYDWPQREGDKRYFWSDDGSMRAHLRSGTLRAWLKRDEAEQQRWIEAHRRPRGLRWLLPTRKPPALPIEMSDCIDLIGDDGISMNEVMRRREEWHEKAQQAYRRRSLKWPWGKVNRPFDPVATKVELLRTGMYGPPYWSTEYRSVEEIAEKSLKEWTAVIEPWLAGTRDPVKFADIAKRGSIGSPGPYQAFYAFRAGRLEEARAILEAMCQGEKRTYEEWRRELKGTLITPKTWPNEPDPKEIESRMKRDRDRGDRARHIADQFDITLRQ